MSPSETDGLCDSGVAGVNQPVIWDLMVERIAGLNQSGEKLTEAWSAGVIEWKDASSWVRRAQQKGPELHPDSLKLPKLKSENAARSLQQNKCSSAFVCYFNLYTVCGRLCIPRL